MTAQSGLTAILGGALKPMGFRRRRYNWSRAGGSLYSIVNVQKSEWGDTVCYVNLGFSPADRVADGWQAENKCHVRFRFDALLSTLPEDLRLLDQDRADDMGVSAWEMAVADRIAQPIARLLACAHEVSDLRNLLHSKVSARVFLDRDMRELLERRPGELPHCR